MTGSPSPVTGTIEPGQIDAFANYLDKEISFLAAMSAVSGGAAVWTVNSLFFYDPAKKPAVLCALLPLIGWAVSTTVLAKIVAVAFAAASVFFLMQRGQLSIKLGRLARSRALQERVPAEALNVLVRDVSNPNVIRTLWQYYLGRILFALGVAGVLLMAIAL